MLSTATLFVNHLKPPFLLHINLYLEQIYLKKQTDHSLKSYKKQRRNYCSRLYKKVRKKNFFSTLNLSFVEDNKLFGKTVKLFFSNKGNLGQNIKLVEENDLLQNDKEIADEVNSFFKNSIPKFFFTKCFINRVTWAIFLLATFQFIKRIPANPKPFYPYPQTSP